MLEVIEAQQVSRNLNSEKKKRFTLGGAVKVRVDYSLGIPPLSRLFKRNGVNMSDCRLVPKVQTPDSGVWEITASFMGFSNSVPPSVLEFQTICFQHQSLALQEHLALVSLFRENRPLMMETLKPLFPDKVNGKVCLVSLGTSLEHSGSGVNFISCSVSPTDGNDHKSGEFVAYPKGEKILLPSNWIFLVKQRMGKVGKRI